MKNKPLVVPALILVVALFAYFWHFRYGFSNDQSVWGAFGDFLGGVLNPVLTFTTVYLLIKSLESQNRSLANSESSAKDTRDALAAQQETEVIKQFDSLFFAFVQASAGTYQRFVIRPNSKNDFFGHEAITFIVNEVEHAASVKGDIASHFNFLDELHHNVIYELVQAYASVFKVILEFCPEKYRERYVAIAISFVPAKVFHLISMAEAYTKWPVLEPMRTLKIFEKPSVAKMVAHFKKIAIY